MLAAATDATTLVRQRRVCDGLGVGGVGVVIKLIRLATSGAMQSTLSTCAERARGIVMRTARHFANLLAFWTCCDVIGAIMGKVFRICTRKLIFVVG